MHSRDHRSHLIKSFRKFTLIHMEHRSFKDHFSGHAEQYGRYRPLYPDSLFRYLASVAPARGSAWDCATGTGQAAKALAGYFDRVIATDASERQIENAARDPKIDYRVEPSENTSIEDGVIDLITVAQALHWFDAGMFYREAVRVLKPKGIIAVWSYNLLRVSPELDAVIDELYLNRVGEYWPPERRLIENAYRGIDFPFEEIRPPKVNMFANWSFTQLIGYLGTWSAVQRYKQARDRDPVALLAERLAKAWGHPDTERKVNWPLALRVGQYGG